MQPHYPERFEREMACTEAEWLRWLPGAIGSHEWQQRDRSADVLIPGGSLELAWVVAEPRAIASVRLPRLLVSFRFSGLDGDQRRAFMTRFDLHMQRGGG
jgi:hypothetical protein